MRKRVWVAGLCAVLMMTAVPAMAVDVEISGHYFVEHFDHSNETLSKEDGTSDYSSMELMVKPVFTINENITLTTQFTALEDHVWGSDAGGPSDGGSVLSPKMDNTDNFNWKAAYMTIKTPIGGFVVGRFIDTPWGSTGLGDTTAAHGNNDYHKDRIMYVLPIGNTISGLVYQKNSEGDKGHDFTDKDFEKYYGFTSYNAENWSAGILISNYHHKNFTTDRDLRSFQRGYTAYQGAVADATRQNAIYNATYAGAVGAGIPQAMVDASAQTGAALPGLGTAVYDARLAADLSQARATAAGIPVAGGPTRSKLNLWVFDPYFSGKFGGLSIDAELLYGIGTIKLRDTGNPNDYYYDRNGRRYDEIDAEGIAATLDLNYTLNRWTFNAGATYVQGDSDYLDDKISAIGYLEPSVDLEHGFLLTSDISGLETTLGGTDANGIPLGNLSGGPSTLTGSAGYRMFWIGAKYQVLETLQLGVLFVKSKADDAPYVDLNNLNAGQWDDDHGIEYDFTVKWDIMENLTFNGVVAYLDAGDYWKKGVSGANVEDNLTFYGQLILTF